MGTLEFHLNGKHTLSIPDGELCAESALDVIAQRSYPLAGLTSEPRVVVDLGAHVGEFTLLAAVAWPGATVYGYEPFPLAFELLEKNCAGYRNIKIVRAAYQHAGGAGVLYLSRSSVCNSLRHNATHFSYPPQTLTVETCSTADIEALRPDVLKVDIEGSEFALFSNLSDEALEGITRIYLEFHSASERCAIHERLSKTHSLEYSRSQWPDQGEVMYDRLQTK
jgi:FkbM family methyltransferase